jgi:RNase P subunit RPR2
MADPASGIAPTPSAERLAAITSRASFLYNKDVVKVCAVCDQQRFHTDPLPWLPVRHKTMLVNALPGAAQYFLVATDSMELHDDLREQYNVSKLVPEEMRQYVSELLLSPRGMGQDGHITVCTNCHSSLVAGNKPKFCIANGYTSTHSTCQFQCSEQYSEQYSEQSLTDIKRYSGQYSKQYSKQYSA